MDIVKKVERDISNILKRLIMTMIISSNNRIVIVILMVGLDMVN